MEDRSMPDKPTNSPASAGHSPHNTTEVLTRAKHGLSSNSTLETPFMETNSSNAEVEASANTSGILPEIEAIDTELQKDATDLAEKESERQAETSRENGSKGGRPPINRDELAKLCLEIVFAHHGKLLLHRYKGCWFEYTNGIYKLSPEEEIEKHVTGFLTQVSDLKGGVTTSLVRDVMTIMKAVGYCGLSENTHKMPCFISTGADASRFLPMKNGILDVEATIGAIMSGAPLPSLLPNTPDLFIDRGFDYDYDPAATCPRFMAYLEKVQPNLENRKMLQMMAGLLLLPDMSYNVAFFLYGQGGTGKTVFINILEGLLGEENCCCVPLANFAARFDKIHLTEKLANLVGDMPIMPDSGRIADMEGLFKSVTSGDEISVERKFVDSRTARVTARCVFATNEMPHFSDRSNGIWDRLRIIKFNVVVRNTDEQDPLLIDKLMEERPGILNWALQGLAELRTYKVFPHSEESRLVLEELRAESDHEATFLDETVQADPEGEVKLMSLYRDYRKWCQDNGFNSPVSISKFKHAILRVFPDVNFTRRRDKFQGRISVIEGISFI
jgi:putative DNA primase/helicase